MTLHLVFSQTGYATCEIRCTEKDVIVLLGDGVYVQDKPPVDVSVVVLEQDMLARGISTTNIAAIDYADLVGLCEQYSPVMSWND